MLFCVLTATTALTPPPISPDRTFRRARLLTPDPAVSTRDIVNVLGRWQTHSQWDTIGELKQIDTLFDWKTWQPLNPLPSVSPSFFSSRRASDSERGTRYAKEVQAALAKGRIENSVYNRENVGSRRLQGDPRRTPQRRGFAKRNGLVQRVWHNENVAKLPFRSRAMAESIGCTAVELNRLPLNPVACEVVFDALSESQGGITGATQCDARRVSYETERGGFDAAAFDAALVRGRLNVAIAYLFFPVGPSLISWLVFFTKADGVRITQEYLQQTQAVLAQ